MSEQAGEPDTIRIQNPVLRRGFVPLPKSVMRADLSPGAKMAYAHLLAYAWQDERRCFPGQERLAVDMRVDRRSVIRYLNELRAGQFLHVQRRGQGKTNVYTLLDGPDVTDSSPLDVTSGGPGPDVTDSSHLEVTAPSPPDVTATSHKKDEGEKDSEEREPGYRDSMGSRPLAQSRGAREEPPALLTRTLTDYAREMNDAPERLRASLTRLARLYARSGLEVTDFHALMHAARVTALARGNIEKEAERGTPYGTPKNRLPYWFTVLEGLALSS